MPAPDEDAGRRGAVLAGVEVPGDRDVLGRVLDVGVVEHDDGRLAAEFQVRSLEVLGRGGRDLEPGARRTGYRHHRRRLVGDDLAAGVAVTAHDVEHALREDLGRDLGHQHGRHRCGVTGLEHDGVTGGQGGRDLPDRHHHRVVPRRDLPDDADRFAADVRGEAGHVLPGAAAFEQTRGTGEEPDLVQRGWHLLRAGQLHRLAGVLALGLDDVVGAGLHGVGELEQHALAVRGRGVAPCLERRARGAVGGVDVLNTGDRRRPEHVAGRGVDQVAATAIGGVHQLAVDEVLDCARHVLPLALLKLRIPHCSTV